MRDSYQKIIAPIAGRNKSTSERGGILLFFAIFMMMLIPLLALSVDGYNMIQSKLDEQNIAEYFSYSALSGYINSSKALHTEKAVDAVNRMKTIQDRNKILGIQGNTWDFNTYTCFGNYCSGEGWRIEFGQYYENSGTFQALPPNSGGPGQLDSSSVEAIRTRIVFSSNFSFLSYFTSYGQGQNEGGTPNINSLGISYITASGAERSYRLGRRTATMD